MPTQKRPNQIPTAKMAAYQKEAMKAAALNATQQSANHLRSILDSIHLGIQENDLEGVITYSNTTHHQLLGLSPGKLIGKRIWDLLQDPTDKADIRDYLTYLIAEQPFPEPMINLYQRTDGSEIWLRMDWCYRLNPQGELVGFTTIITDVSEHKEFEFSFADSEVQWKEAMNQTDHIVFMLSQTNELQKANCAFYRFVELNRSETQGMQIERLIPKASPVAQSILAHLANIQPNESLVVDVDPASIYEIRSKNMVDDYGIHIGRLITVTDLSDIKSLNKRLKLFSSVFENTAEGIMVTDERKNIIEINAAFTEITGYTRDDVLNKKPTILSSGRHNRNFYTEIWRDVRNTGRWSGEIWNRHKSGRVFPELLTINVIRDVDDKVTHYIGIFSDISSLKRTQEKIEHLSQYDALTDLPNRSLVIERLEQAVKHARRTQKRCALVLLDLDRFKHINESYGHSIGDRLLCAVANNLRLVVRDDDTLARVGGDEFVLLFEDIDNTEHLGFMIERIQSALANAIELPDQCVNMTASMGICVYPEDGSNASELMRNVDAAMYHAKAQGRNTYQFYTEELTHKAFEILSLENDLRQAIKKSELELYYQPQIELETGTIVGAEALLRWKHRTLGTVSPSRFIPIAEESGLIVDIGDWVLEEGCKQIRAWQNKGINLHHLAINVAAMQLIRGGLVERLSNLLALYRIDPKWIELEVTEGFVMDRSEKSIMQLGAIRQLGVSLAIDDFGTGYSSLSYLKDLPMNKLKIDQSFVRGIPDDMADTAITKTILALGVGLDISVIAEGVETEQQSAFLYSAGCHYAQGYLYGKPMPADEFEALLSKKSKT